MWFWIPALFTAAVLLLKLCRDKSRKILLLSLFFVFFGMARGQYDVSLWESRRAVAEEMEGRSVKSVGRLSAVARKDDTVVLTLKDNLVVDMTWDGGMAESESEVETEPEGEIKSGAKTKISRQYRVPCIEVSIKETELESELHIGMMLSVYGAIKGFSTARNPGEFDYRAYNQALGKDCGLFGDSLQVVNDKILPLPDLLYRIREGCKRILYRTADEKDAGIFCAAVLGDKKGLDEEIRDLYQKNGIAHLLAISGLHLSIIGMGAYRILRKMGLRYGTAGMVSTCFVICYGMLTGGSASVVRAVTMMIAGFLASYLGRTYDILSASSLALFLIGLWSPGLLLQGGVQLSFGAVFAIGGVSPVLSGWLGEKATWKSALAVSLSIQLVTFPIILYHFFQFPLYGIFLNFLVIPFMGAVVCSAIGTIVFGGVSWFLGTMAAGSGHYILELYEWLCRFVSGLPYYNVIMGRPDMAHILVYYGVFITCLVVMWVVGRKGMAEPEKLEKKKGGQSMVLLRFTALLCMCLSGFLFLRPLPEVGLDVTFLDVGQGDGILLRSENLVVLVDGGSTSEESLGKFRLEPCLKSYGISEIDYVFVSHGDKDHISGVEYLLEECEDIYIKHLMFPAHGKEDKALNKLKLLAETRNTEVTYLTAGDWIRESGLTITCLYPGTFDIPADTNEESTVLQMDYENCHLLFTGDMSKSGEENLLLKGDEVLNTLSQVQILKIAHHGSRYSSCDAFLDAVNPRWAVISYGENNSYGHPHKEVQDRLQERQIEVWETAEGGAVTMHTDGKKIQWRVFR